MRPSASMAMRRDVVREILKRFHMENPRIFGSVARGEDADGSDLDILVEAPLGTTLYDLAKWSLSWRRLSAAKSRC